MNPDLEQAFYNKALCLHDLCHYNEAVTFYEKTISLNPTCHEAFYNKGISLYELGLFQEAFEAYDIAINLNPLSDEFYFNEKGKALRKLNRYEEATECLNNHTCIKKNKKISI